ncbi:MAG: S-layer homology domain-containing protein [Candidatus Sericytochromatia bacterium]|nr:S-layer homology domain-containing protein [Candidatus Sericytochromatia bacterium]
MRSIKTSLAALLSASLIALFPTSGQAQLADGFTDMPAEHWASTAVRDLVEKYGVMAGFPDKTFRGTRQISRYEAAAAFYKVMLQLSQVEDLTRRIGNITLEDLKTMKTLHQEFQQELETIKQQQSDQAEKIRELENSLAKLKEDMGSVRFGGLISIGAEDVFEDNFRPGYSTYFSLNMRIAATESTTIHSALTGSFSSTQEERDGGTPNEKSQFKENRDVGVNFGEAWFDHRVGGFLSPRVKFGYMGVTRLITPFSSVSHQFGNSIVGILDRSAVSRAIPNMRNGNSYGIRLANSFIAGAEVREGVFSGAVAASPDVFWAQAMLNFGWARLKLISEGDQAIFIGEPVLDTLHNHTAILDIGNDVFGVSTQATFRGLANEFDFRGAATNANWNFSGFSLGGSGKFESEKTYQQVIGGVYFSTPSNLKQMNPEWADVNIPSLLFAVQSPFTLQNGELFEGSPDEVGDMAGFMVQLSYDNPIIPNLTVELGRRQKVLINTLPQDSNFDKTTVAISSSFVF